MATLKLIGLASGEPTPFDGSYVVEYDPGRDGLDLLACHLVTTPDRDLALHASTKELMMLWRSVDPRDPVRSDGKPNRPLTAFTVEIT